MDFSTLLAALQHSPYLAALALISMLARAWVTDRSAFPLTLPASWQPVITALAAAALNATASLQAGIGWQVVVMTSLAWAASTGFLDGILVAAWGDPKKAPIWARWAVMIFDDVERLSGAGPTGSSGTGSSTGGGGGAVGFSCRSRSCRKSPTRRRRLLFIPSRRECIRRTRAPRSSRTCRTSQAGPRLRSRRRPRARSFQGLLGS